MFCFNKNIFSAIVLTIFLFCPVRSQKSQQDEIIFKAMTDELTRNLTQLALPNYKPPFYISYHLYDVQTMTIQASLGSLQFSHEVPVRSQHIRLMEGDYALNDENFMGTVAVRGNSLPVPLENNYDAIRRAFWISSDRSYKSAVQNYDQKTMALKQQNNPDAEKTDDFMKADPVTFISENSDFKTDKTKWENVAREVSAVFMPYNEIASSTTYLYFLKAWIYTVSSEGTKIKYPLNVSCFLVNACTQASDGEPLMDHVLYFADSPDQLPDVQKIRNEVKQMAEELVTLRNVPAMKESYAGPVIFEGDAVAEIFSQKFFGLNSGLVTFRDPVLGSNNRFYQPPANRFDQKIGQKICAVNISVKDLSKSRTYNGIPLIGSYDIDAEGIVPPDELTLVQKGILKTLLSDRIPTQKVKESNGHRRIVFGYGGSLMMGKAPGVVNISYENGKTPDSVKNAALQEFAGNGLDYIYVVKKMEVPNAGIYSLIQNSSLNRNLPISKPILIYKVSTKTGEEQPFRSALLGDFPLYNFKQIMMGSNEQMVYNTVMFRGGIQIPASFIVPKVLVFEDVSLEPDKGIRSKLPVVPNPVAANE